MKINVKYFLKKNSNILFNEYGELHCRRNRKAFSIILFQLVLTANAKNNKFLYLNFNCADYIRAYFVYRFV